MALARIQFDHELVQGVPLRSGMFGLVVRALARVGQQGEPEVCGAVDDIGGRGVHGHVGQVEDAVHALVDAVRTRVHQAAGRPGALRSVWSRLSP